MLMSKLRVGAAVVFGALAAGTGIAFTGDDAWPGGSSRQSGPSNGRGDGRSSDSTNNETTPLDFGGNAVPSATIEIGRAITSQIEKVAFQPGARVKPGTCYSRTGDSRTGQADFLKAGAELQQAEGRLRHAKTRLGAH